MDNASDPDRTPKEIHVAARSLDAERLRVLISNGADPDATFVAFVYPDGTVIRRTAVDAVFYALSPSLLVKLSPNDRDAAPGRAAACIAALLEAGASPHGAQGPPLPPDTDLEEEEEESTYWEARVHESPGPVARAAIMGHAPLVELLCKAGADVHSWRNLATGECSLHYTVRDGHVEVVRTLLRLGAKVNVYSDPDSPGSLTFVSPLDIAIICHRRRMYPLLLRAGARLTRAELDKFGGDHFDAWGNLIEDPQFQEPPMTPDRADADSPYLAKVLAAGSYKAYEKAHLKRLVDMFLPKFPDLPAEIIPNIVRHWGHVGYY
mgnify:CR=1 FL=1